MLAKCLYTSFVHNKGQNIQYCAHCSTHFGAKDDISLHKLSALLCEQSSKFVEKVVRHSAHYEVQKSTFPLNV